MKSVVNTEEICKPTQLLPYHLRPEKKEQRKPLSDTLMYLEFCLDSKFFLIFVKGNIIFYFVYI